MKARIELTRAEIRELYNTIIANPEIISLGFNMDVEPVEEDCPNCEQSPCVCVEDDEDIEIREAREFLKENGFIE